MNQQENDILFWDQVESDWAELSAKPIIMSEPLNDAKITSIARIALKKGRLRDTQVGFMHRRYASLWGLQPPEVDQLMAMQIMAEAEETATDIPDTLISQLADTNLGTSHDA